jgi:hypothetical protein
MLGVAPHAPVRNDLLLTSPRGHDLTVRRDHAAAAEESIDQLTRLAASLLDVSRLQAGAQAVFPRPVELGGIMADSLDITPRAHGVPAAAASGAKSSRAAWANDQRGDQHPVRSATARSTAAHHAPARRSARPRPQRRDVHRLRGDQYVAGGPPPRLAQGRMATRDPGLTPCPASTRADAPPPSAYPGQHFHGETPRPRSG